MYVCRWRERERQEEWGERGQGRVVQEVCIINARDTRWKETTCALYVGCGGPKYFDSGSSKADSGYVEYTKLSNRTQPRRTCLGRRGGKWLRTACQAYLQ